MQIHTLTVSAIYNETQTTHYNIMNLGLITD